MRRYFFGIIITLLLFGGLFYFLYSTSKRDRQTDSAVTSGQIYAGMKLGTYHEASTDKGKVVVGDQNYTHGAIKPEVTLSKWDNETKLNIKYNIGSAKPTAIDNGITWKGSTQDLIYKETPARKVAYVPPKKPIIRLADFSNKVRYIKFGPSSLSTIASSYELFEKENSPDPTITTYIPNEDGYFYFGYKTAELDLRNPKEIKYPIVRLKADMESFSCPVIPFTKNGGFVVRFYYPNIVNNGEMYRQMFVAAMNNALKKEGVDTTILLKSDFLYYLDGIRPVEVGRIGYDTNNLIFYLYTDSPLTSSPLKDNLRLQLVLRDVLFPFSDLKTLKSTLTPDFQDKIVDEFLKLAKYDGVPSTLNTDELALLRGLEGLQKEPDWKLLGLRSDLPNRIGDEQKFDKFEFDLLLHQKPDNNVFTYDIDTQGLDFFYQTPLTEEQKDNGGYQPEDVAGSYAVYKKDSTNIYDNSVDAEKYMTGKVMQIYRPKITDSKGNMTWGTLNVNTAKHSLTVTVDDKFLEDASYPVLVDPTFGYLTQGGNLDFSADLIQGDYYSMPANGTLFSMSAYISGSCFTGDTLITMADGTYKKIKDIEVGDKVKSYNEKKKIIENDTVEKLIIHPPEEMGDYYLSITTENNKKINVTPNHLVYLNGSWIPAGELKVNDSLLSDRSEDIKILSISKVYKKVSVFTLTIVKNHNFFTTFLVHNKKNSPATEVGIYKQSDGSMLATSSENTTDGWLTFPMSSVALTASVNYWLFVNRNGDEAIMYDNGGGNGGTSSQTYGTWPNPVGTITTNARKYSLYATYVAAGAVKTNLKGGMNLRGNVNFR